MKIALCFAGQPRYFSDNHAFWVNALQGLDVDVFVHAWYDPTVIGTKQGDPSSGTGWTVEPNSDKRILKLYKPKKSLFEKQKVFTDEFDELAKTYFTEEGDRIWLGTPKVFLSSMYSIKTSVGLMKQYCSENPHIKYDQVIVTRFDFIYIKRLIDVLKKENESFMTAYVPGEEWNTTHLNDVFLVSNYDNILEYAKHFDRWKEDLDSGIAFCPHRLRFAYLKKSGHSFEQIFTFPNYPSRKWFLNRGRGLEIYC